MKRPLLVGAIIYIIGILWGLYFFKISIVLIFCVLVYIFLNKFNISKSKAFYGIVLLLGFIQITYCNKNYENKITILKNNNNWINAKVISTIEEHDYINSCKVKLREEDGTKVILYISKDKSINLDYGDNIILKGEFQEASDASNYKGFSYKNYLKAQGICGSLKVSDIKIVKKEDVNIILKYFQNLKHKIVSNINYIFENKKEAGIALGMIIGNDNYLEEEIQEGFKKSSLTHILCVSGSNMAYIIILRFIYIQKN